MGRNLQAVVCNKKLKGKQIFVFEGTGEDNFKGVATAMERSVTRQGWDQKGGKAEGEDEWTGQPLERSVESECFLQLYFEDLLAWYRGEKIAKKSRRGLGHRLVLYNKDDGGNSGRGGYACAF